MGRLIVQPYGGLCNRLRAVVSGSLLAESLGREFQVDWIPDPATCGCLPSDLFRSFPGAQASPSDAPVVHVSDAGDLRALSGTGPQEDIRIRTQSDLRPAGPDPSSIELEFVRRLRSIEPVASIAGRIPSLPPRALGLHIRRGDHWLSTRYSPLHLFTRAVEEADAADGETSIFLATDSPEVTSALARRYGPRLIHIRDKSISRASAAGVADALVDLLTLSRTRVVYASAQSSFSVMAAQWGGATLRTLKLPGSPPDFAGTVMDRLHHRFLRFEAEIGEWRPRKARTAAGRAAIGLLSPVLLRRAAIAASDAYQEGRARLRY